MLSKALGLLFIPITLRVGWYWVKKKIKLGDGQDDGQAYELIKRIRGQGNFVETVPLALVLLLLMEVLRVATIWLHALAVYLVSSV